MAIFEEPTNAAMAAQNILEDLNAGTTTFDSFVESLGPKITSTNIEQRLEGYEKMIAVVEGLDRDFLSAKQLKFVSDFVRARLKDHSSLMSPTLRGIRALLNCANLNEECANDLLQGLFMEGNCQAGGLDDRLVYYRIFSTALAKFPELSKKLGSSFVLAFISAMDGERDPRGLVTAFPLHAAIASFLPAGPIVEDLFEVVACYFPVDFSPAGADDAKRVTREELSLGLKTCLSATAAFAPFCLPLIIEKLESSLPSTKIDSLALLHTCLQFYSNADLGENMRPLWKLLTDEILTGKDPNVSSASVLCLGSLFAAGEVPPILNPVDDLLEETFKVWERNFKHPEDRMVIPASSMWISVLGKSDAARKRYTEQTLHLIVSNLKKTELQSHDMVSVLSCAIDFFQNVTLESLKDLDDRQACVVALLKLSVDPAQDVRGNVFEALGVFLPVCTDEEVNLIVSYLGAASVTEKDSVAIEGICTCIKNLVELDLANDGGRTLILTKRVLESMKKDIGDAAASVQTGEEDFLPIGSRCLWSTCAEAKSLRAATDSLFEAAHGWAQSGGGEKDPSSTLATARCVAVLRQLWQDASKTSPRKAERSQWMSEALPFAVKRIVAFAIDHVTTLVADERIPEDLAAALDVAIEFTDEEEVKAATENLMRCIFPDITGNSGSRFDKTNLSMVRLLDPLITRVCSHQEVESFAKFLIKKAVDDAVTDHAADSCCRMLSAILNRLTDDEVVAMLLSETSEHVDEAQSFKVASGKKFYLACWVTLSLGLRNHPGFRSWLRKLVHSLETGTEPDVAEKGFSVLFRDLSSGPLSPSSPGVNFNPLHKQKTFLMVLPDLVGGIRGKNEACAAALVPMLKNVPVSVLGGCQDQVIPCLVLALNTLAPESILSCLTCLGHLMKDALDLVASHIDTLVPRMLVFANYEGSMKVRMEALNCLRILAEAPETKILPLRPKIIADLKPVLADKKRLVRKAAAEARSAWYLVGEMS